MVEKINPVSNKKSKIFADMQKAHRITNGINLKTSDRVKIAGAHYKMPAGSPGILLLHMMAATRDSWQGFAGKLNEAGIGALAIDLRGHGESDGGPEGYKSFSDGEHQKSIEDVRAGIAFQKAEPHEPLFIAGASIGANLALQYMAENNEISRTILLSPGINYKGIETLPLAQKIKPEKQVYVVAAKDDQNVEGADKQAQEIYDALNCKKELKIFEVGGHGTDILDAHPDFMDELISWLIK